MANIEHWLARLPSMIGPVVLDANNVRAYRDSGWTVEGPFVPADHLRGAVEERDALLLFARNYAKWKTTADLNRLDAQVRGLLAAFGGQ